MWRSLLGAGGKRRPARGGVISVPQFVEQVGRLVFLRGYTTPNLTPAITLALDGAKRVSGGAAGTIAWKEFRVFLKCFEECLLLQEQQPQLLISGAAPGQSFVGGPRVGCRRETDPHIRWMAIRSLIHGLDDGADEGDAGDNSDSPQPQEDKYEGDETEGEAAAAKLANWPTGQPRSAPRTNMSPTPISRELGTALGREKGRAGERKRVFNALDLDGDGKICPADLVFALQTAPALGEKLGILPTVATHSSPGIVRAVVEQLFADATLRRGLQKDGARCADQPIQLDAKCFALFFSRQSVLRMSRQMKAGSGRPIPTK